jgi:tRNA-modifying protein YgfZ
MTDLANTEPANLEQHTYLMPLTHYGLLSIQGPDTSKFLQGQVTCDVHELHNNRSRLGAQCNIKGRMLLCFRALQTHSEQIVLRMQQTLIEQGLSSLGKYSVFSKVTLVDTSGAYRCIGIAGAQASRLLQDLFAIQIAENDQWQTAQDSFFIRIAENRFECWLTADRAEAQWQQLAAHCTLAGENLWQLLDIQAGLGDITPETYDIFTPQTINFQLVNGINFRKGCYTGQEIVARLHYRGSLKRHMYRFAFSTQDKTLPAPNSSLVNSEGKTVGEVIVAAYTSSRSGELLASLVDDQIHDAYLAPHTEKLSLLSLPYAIPTPNSAD